MDSLVFALGHLPFLSLSLLLSSPVCLQSLSRYTAFVFGSFW